MCDAEASQVVTRAFDDRIGLRDVANAAVVVGLLVAAPNVGKRDSRSPCRWRHDLANHRSPRTHTCTPPTKTSMILRRPLLRTEGVGMSSLTAGLKPDARSSARRSPDNGRED